MLQQVEIDKLVNGGQGLGTLPTGQKIFVWNALPGETVGVRVGRKKRDYAEGFAEEIINPSKHRQQPIDEAYLSTSPWQIMTYAAENDYKKQILADVMQREGVQVPDLGFEYDQAQQNYRNKMEYSFWGDDQGLHLALFHRASHGKRIVTGSSIARPEIDQAANKILDLLNKNGVRASDLNTGIIRVNSVGKTLVALFVKNESFANIDFSGICQGVVVYYSTPKSPASVITKQLYRQGSIILSDNILGHDICYDVNSFFQVNLPIFCTALQQIIKHTKGQKNIVDMYSGVGTIGIAIGANSLVELDNGNVAMAKQNTASLKNIQVVAASAEQATESITNDSCVVFDPPRAGLHQKLTTQLLEIQPSKIIYLSCNPATQARDLAILQHHYKVTHLTGYNFFPRTPHIESLAVLVKQ